MTIKFIPSKYNIYANTEEKNIIRSLIYNLCDSQNPYTVINLIYNNAEHNGSSLANSSFNVCTKEQLCDISNKAKSKSNTIYIEGNIHSYNHTSNLLVNPFNPQQPLFVKDQYIRIRINDKQSPPIHILTNAPAVETADKNLQFVPPIVYLSPSCEKLDFVIGPYINII
jgi:hypothetical protein